jgi:hypothetical protein
MLYSADKSVVLAAEIELEKLKNDDSRQVATAAAEALEAKLRTPQRPPVVMQTPPVPGRGGASAPNYAASPQVPTPSGSSRSWILPTVVVTTILVLCCCGLVAFYFVYAANSSPPAF